MRVWSSGVLAAAFSLAALSAQQPAAGGAEASVGAGTDVVGADAEAWRPHRALRVLYAGWPGGTREAAFRAFLERHFDRVAVVDLAKLTAAAAKEHDVVIADWASQYGNDGYPKRENSLLSAPVDLADDFEDTMPTSTCGNSPSCTSQVPPG